MVLWHDMELLLLSNHRGLSDRARQQSLREEQMFLKAEKGIGEAAWACQNLTSPWHVRMGTRPTRAALLGQGRVLGPVSRTGLWLLWAAREHSSLAIRPLE